ncbi:MAG: DNA mismatch repair endonuclease MutL [Thermoflexales bacterium]|nr:DNA mismatch repair endonuclease MutL [Thermoflexales bacterium]
MIRVLPPEIVAQIAAGEVVGRPASVIKELVENSIDAGAREIRIEVADGGKRMMRVADDGCGIPAAEVELAFQRHATSKLASAEDLNRIATLGFRGEALASIAAVSRVICATRAAEEETGTLIRLEGGEVVSRRPIGRPPGTTVTVEDIFYNVPARRKFLRSSATERRHIDAWITRYAMAYPTLRFALVHDGREVFRSPGTGRMRDVLVAVYGVEVGSALLEIPPEEGATVRVEGFVSPPYFHRADRGEITLFVNGRWVQDARLTYAVIQAYHTLIPTGRYPLAVVMVTLPPEDVDVNVHPAKAEVRFRDGDGVFRAVQRAVRQAVTEEAGVPRMQAISGPAPPAHPPELRFPEAPRGEPVRPTPMPMLVPPVAPAARLPVLRVIGQVAATYIIAEGPDGLYLIDQHAAHERVLYERMMAQRSGGIPVQSLLEPVAVDLPPEWAGLVEAHQETLHRLGVEVEPFGGNTFLIRALPVALTSAHPRDVLTEVAQGLAEEGGEARRQQNGGAAEEEIERAIIRRVCKQGAIKAGQVLSREEMEELLRALERCENPRTCPHGRPTMIHISTAQLAREFQR